MLPRSVQAGISITAKQATKPLLVHNNSAPQIPGASQAIRGFKELGFFKNV